DANAPFPAPHEDTALSETIGQPQRIGIEEAHVARTLLARLGGDDGEAALHEALAQLAREIERVLGDGGAIQALVDTERVVEDEETEEVRIAGLEAGGVRTKGHLERIFEATPVEHAVPAHGGGLDVAHPGRIVG